MDTEGGVVNKFLLFFLITLICQMAPGQGVGGNGVPGAGTGSANIPATSNLLKGAGTAGSATAATPGTDYITPSPGGANQTINQTSGSTLGVTNLNKIFYVSGFPTSCTTNEGSFSNQIECAWFTVYDLAVANNISPTLQMGYGAYNLSHSLYEPTQSLISISLVGPPGGNQGTALIVTGTLNDAVIYKNETASGGALPSVAFRDFKIYGQDSAQGCLRLWGFNTPVVQNISCVGIPNGAPFFYQFGEPNNYGQGWIFNLMAKNLEGGNTLSVPSTVASITANLAGSTLSSFTVNSGGAGYGAASVEQTYYVLVTGNKNGTSDQPCTVMPTGMVATITSGAVSSISAPTAGGTGCSGTIEVHVIPISNIPIDIDNWASDSTVNDAATGATIIGIRQSSGNTKYYGAHPTGHIIGIQSTQNDIWKDTELDTNYQWGFDFQNSSGAEVDGTNTFNNSPYFAVYHLGNSATVQFGPQSGLCVATTPTDYHEFLMPYGTYEANGYLPAGSSVAANDTLCSSLGSIFQQPVNLPAIAPASSGTPTYSSNPFTMSSSAWISSAVANHKWVWQANENSGGTYHYLTMTPPDPLNSEMDLGGNVLVQPTGTATASANFNSPQLGTNASWWNGTGNQSTTFGLSLAPASGTNPAEVGTIGFSNCSSGGCTLQLPPLSAPVTAPGFFAQSGAAGPYSTFFDDFYTGANMASDPIGSPASSSCSPNDTYTDNNHPGNMLLTAGTGGSGTGIVCGLVSENPSITSANTSQGWTWETAVYVPVLPGTTAGAYQAGMAHTPNANPWTTGIGFYLSSANGVVNDWYCRYNSTSTDSGIAATVAWTRLTMVNDGTNVHWYIGGTQVCGTGVAIANMPSTAQYPAVWSATALSGSSVTMAYDYINWQRAVNR
jgi:hypothetical protein